MLLVKTKIGSSKISGIGLFADQFISKGTLIWKFQEGFDLLLSAQEMEKLSEPAKAQFINYAYLDTKRNQYLLCSDDARFFNHSKNPNCDDSKDDETTSLQDITKGEELTVDYNGFCGNLEDHPEVN